MPTVWIISEDAASAATLALHLGGLGRVFSGPPERGRFAEADAPDVAVLIGAASEEGDLSGLERLLGFLRGIERHRRASCPVLYVEPHGGHPSAELVARLIDDRPVASVERPIEVERVVAEAARLLDRASVPISLRERARREWVTDRVERLYSSAELPALRHAIDPRNAVRPVLLLGEPGSEHGLLARYIHNLAEPPRDRLLVLSPAALPSAGVEEHVLERSAGQRVSVYFEDLDAASPALQQEMAHCLASSGMSGIEPIRWIASARRADRLTAALRRLGWIQVDLPALRERSDLDGLIRSVAASACERLSRRVELSEPALAALRSYGWPGNLRELEAVLEASIAGASGERLEANELAIGVRGAPPPAAREPLEAPPTQPEAGRGEGAEAQAGIAEIAAPLAQELRQPLLAIRTCAALLEQRPDDPSVRRELASLVEGDLAHMEDTLHRLERYAAFGPPKRNAVDLAAIVEAELERRRPRMRARSLVVLEELEREAPPALADEEQLRFAIAGLLDRALRMVPVGGDLYLGSVFHPARDGEPARHRLLMRFHSPEEVLVPPADVPGARMPLEVVFARVLIERMEGVFAVDASGAQDNVVLIELPA